METPVEKAARIAKEARERSQGNQAVASTADQDAVDVIRRAELAEQNKPPEKGDLANPEIFFCRIPGSNFAGGATNIVFTPDRYNSGVGRYETADPREIAELKAAIKSGANTIFQDENAVPYARSAIPVDKKVQAAKVAQAEDDIEQRRVKAADDLRKKMEGQQGNLGGIVNTSDLGMAAPSNSKP